MKQWVLKANGSKGVDKLALEEAPMPVPGAGEVRVRVHAVSLNYRDQFIVNEQFGTEIAQDLVPISDGAGEIDAIGPRVTEWKVGDRVAGLYYEGWVAGPPKPGMGWGLGSPGKHGMLAEYVVLASSRVARVPTRMSFSEAATLPCAALTAWTALFAKNPVLPGQKVLVLGTGGVSLFALLLARAAGAQVFATTSQDSKAALLRDLGAHEVVNYRSTPTWGDVLFERTGGGFQKVVNSAGGDSMNQSIAALAFGGEIAFMGLFSAGEGAPLWPALMAKGGSVRGTTVGSATSFAKLVLAIDAIGLEAPIARRFPFEQAKEAYAAQLSADLFGKIVIDVVAS